MPPDSCHSLSIFKRQRDRRCQAELSRADLELGHESICHDGHRLDPTWEISKRSISGPEAWLSRKLAASPFLSVLPSPIPNVKYRSTKALLLPDIYFSLNTICQDKARGTIYLLSRLTATLYCRLKAWHQRDLC